MAYLRSVTYIFTNMTSIYIKYLPWDALWANNKNSTQNTVTFMAVPFTIQTQENRTVRTMSRAE